MSDTVTSIRPEQAAEIEKKMRAEGYDVEISVDPETGEVTGAEGDPEARRTLEQLADETYMPPLLRATNEQLTFNVGQRGQPTGSVLKLKSVEVPLLGQYKLNERVRLVIDIEVEDITFKTIRDKATGSILGRDRVHVATVDEVVAEAD